MPEYDFHTLSPTDFELLARDLLRESLDLELQAFATGRDGGVDLRAYANGHTTVVQCKHYQGSTFSDLKTAAKAEKKNMDLLRPDRYLFVTTQDLTVGQKTELQKLLHPHIMDIQEVLGQKDINQLLGQYPTVELNHFKLWMASTSVLKAIIESGIWRRSEALMEEIQDRVRLYVASSSFAAAREMLTASNVCVITGAPGVGKSMLADMLSLWRWESKWQIVELPSHKVDEAWNVWDNKAKQFFYFDDVFGQTDVRERLSNDSGITVGRLINRVSRSQGTKNLVITTRTHVLHEAEAIDEALKRADLHARECVLEVTEYTRLQRARILYNHLYFSELPRETIREFVNKAHYWPVVKHPNFTPRLVELSIAQQAPGQSAQELAHRLLHALDHPIELWGNSFREALTEPARLLLMHLVAFPPRGAPAKALRAAAMRDAGPLDYTRALNQLEGSWITLVADNPDIGTTISFHNPSCRDFVLSFLDLEPDYYVDVMFHTTDSAQLTQLVQYADSTSGGSVAKYPSLRERVQSLEASQIEEHLRKVWPTDPEVVKNRSADILYSLSKINELYELGLSKWVLENTLSLTPRLKNAKKINGIPAWYLANLLMRKLSEPTPGEQVSSCKLLYLAWCNAIDDHTEWNDVFEFREWIGDVDWSGDEESAVAESFESWLDAQFEAILENAEDADTARTWVEEVQYAASLHFGDGYFDRSFDEFEESVKSKYGENYEPSAEDLESMRAGDAIESSSDLAETMRARFESEDAQVRGLFDQLG